MQVNLEQLPKTIDIAAITANTLTADVDFAMDLAKTYNCFSTCVNPCYLAYSIKIRQGRTDIRSGVTAGFPFGGELTSVKLYGCQQSVLLGAEEIDMVMNVGEFLSGNLDVVERELRLITETVEKPVKVIIETALLDDAQIAVAARLAADCGVSYVKTSTGIYGKKVTPEIIRIMKDAVDGKAKIKAAGGIRTLDEAKALLEAGADRLGISPAAAWEVLKQLDKELGRSSPELKTMEEM